ncbi:MAG: hypothetical protein JJ992_19760 [Planctomycetes bacterium]|nr:hypothetical protein [Planctomycetota bacterium]
MLEWRDGTPVLFWNLGVGWLVAGEPAKALEYFDKAPPGNREMGRVMAFHDLGRLDEFEAEFAAMRANPEEDPEGIARIAAWTGQNDLAFEYLEYAAEKEGPRLARSVRTDLYEPIKSDPRWQAFLDRYDATDDDFSHIRFNPILPEEVLKALERR